jgi:hypothetical protein
MNGLRTEDETRIQEIRQHDADWHSSCRYVLVLLPNLTVAALILLLLLYSVSFGL